MKVYLAGKWQEAATIKQYADELRSLGHTITMPWFECHVAPAVEELRQSAIEDFNGVCDADIAIFIFEKKLPYAGAYTELGIALASGCEVVIVGSGGNSNIFTSMPEVEKVDTWNQAKRYLVT